MNWLVRAESRVVFALALILMLMFVARQTSQLNAQEGELPAEGAAQPAANDGAAADKTADKTAGGWSESLGGMIIKSGWIGIPFYVFLGILSVVATTVGLERLTRLVPTRIMPPQFVRDLQGLIRAGDDEPENYRRLCESSPSPLAAVLRAGLVRAGRPLLEVEKAMEDAMSREIGAIRVRHQPLHVVGGIAPLVGLLGTVVGMIFAFYQSSQAGLGKAEVLAEYIYLALITTALGLTVAIPSMLLAAWFNARADRFMRDMDECLLDMIPVFVQMETSVSADQDSAATNRDVSTSNATLASTGSSTGS